MHFFLWQTIAAELPLNFTAPFEVREFILDDEPSSARILTGPLEFFLSSFLSPDGYRVAHWAWDDYADPKAMIVSLDSPGEPRRLIAEVDVITPGFSPFLRWDDETHFTYGYIDENNERTVTSWRADLCGDVVPLEPYQAP